MVVALEAKLKNLANDLGFDVCRITTAERPESAPHFEAWLRKNAFGEMNWIERNSGKRIDPQQVLPGARSIVVLASSYELNSGRAKEPSANPAGVIARYARFTDYHEVLAERLKKLVHFLDEETHQDGRSLWYVDTGPILERDLAQRAGIGFIGKHTNLISRRLGNWIFLSEILTTIPLDPDPPEKNHCGKCARCISACPTRAITAPFQLDARRCISYLTIELKGSIPLEFRPLIGNRIFGCDDCLEVCPWNRFAREATLMRAHARKDFACPDLIELLTLDQEGFKKRFKNTPIYRTKRRGLLRNVCVALGNSGDSRALPALERTMGDFDPLIAEHAQWAISRIRGRIQVGTAIPPNDYTCGRSS